MIIWGVDFIKTNVWNSFQTFVNIGGGSIDTPQQTLKQGKIPTWMQFK